MDSSSAFFPVGEIGVGKLGFIAEHELWTDEQREAAERLAREVVERGLRQVRIYG